MIRAARQLLLIALASLSVPVAYAQSVESPATEAAPGAELAPVGVEPANVQPAEPMTTAPVESLPTEQPAELDEPTLAPAPSAELMSESELEDLGLTVSGPRVDTDLHFSGFADFTSDVPLTQPHGAVAFGKSRYQSFYVGNINLYLSKNLSDSFRTMGEVRLTYLPNGGVINGPSGLAYQDTSTFDYNEDSRPTRWGGIIMQRVYLEWTLHRLAVIRGGQFLTPYGIWNVDHGSPAYIPVERPYAVNSNYFPERQTGLELFGRWDATNESTLGYHLTLSNGTGSIAEYRDLDKNKAVGGRVYWEYRGAGFFRVGASGYYGRDTSASPMATITNNNVDVVNAISSQYDNLALAADILLKLRGFHVQGEWVSSQRRYTKSGRVSHDVYIGPVASGFPANSLSWSGYGLVGYQLNWYAVTPYFMAEYNKQSLLSAMLTDAQLRVRMFHWGLNIHPIDAVVFKIEYVHSAFPGGGPFFKHDINELQLQAAWAF